MRIAMVTPYLPPKLGGREFYVPQMSFELQKLGCSVKIFSSNTKDKKGYNLIKDKTNFKEIEILKSPILWDFSKISTPITIPPFKDLKRFNPDIIHLHEPNLILTTTLGIYGKFFLKKKIIIHSHSDPFDWLGGNFFFKLALKVYSFIHRFKLKFSDFIIVVSEEYRDYARFFKPFSSKIVVLPMCVSENFFPLNKPKQLNNICYIGRLDRRKGIEYLIYAVKDLKDIELLIVGSGDQETEMFLKKEAMNVMQTNNSIKISFLGKKNQNELNKILNVSMALILPTADRTAETFGIVLIEAMATKTPVIVADNPAPTRIVKDSNGGLIFKSMDSADLKNKIQLLLENPILVQEYGINGFKYVQKGFSYPSVAKRLFKLYERILSNDK